MSRRRILALTTALALTGVGALFLLQPSKHETQPSNPVRVLEAGEVRAAPPSPSALSSAEDKVMTRAQPKMPVYLAIASVIGLATFALLLYARQRRTALLMKSPHIVTPDSFDKGMNGVHDAIRALAEQVHSNKNQIARVGAAMATGLQDTAHTFLTLQSALDQRDKQLARAEQGAEFQITKRVLKRFAKVDQFLNQATDQSAEQRLAGARALLRDALEESDVLLFEPQSGSDVRNEKGCADKPILVETNDGDLYYKVKSTISPGYCIVSGVGQSHVLIDARVEVYAPTGEKP